MGFGSGGRQMTVGGRAFRCLAAVLSVALVGLGTVLGLVATASPASAQVLEPLSASKQFTPDVIPVNGTTTLTFTITNPSDLDATEVLLVDPLPSALVPLSGGSNSCGGTVSTSSTGGQSTVTLIDGTVAAGGVGQYTVNLIAVAAGDWVNTTEPVRSRRARARKQRRCDSFRRRPADDFQGVRIPVGSSRRSDEFDVHSHQPEHDDTFVRCERK